eukprot:s653_g21.t1
MFAWKDWTLLRSVFLVVSLEHHEVPKLWTQKLQACELGTAEPAIQPLQLKLQQVTREDELRTVTCSGGCSGHGECKVGICDCETGKRHWPLLLLLGSPPMLLYKMEEHFDPARVEFIRTQSLPCCQRTAGGIVFSLSGVNEPRIERESSLGTSAATALNSWLKTARTVSKRRPVDELASLLSAAAMAAFALLEQISLAVCAEIGRELGVELSKMPTETSSTMRCIHYDRPLESRGFGDLQAPAEPPAAGTPVRLVGLAGSLACLNGLKGSVISTSPIAVSVAGAPQAVLHARGSQSVTVELANLRLLSSKAPGMYPAHTDSSLITVAPCSSAPGLEVKDLQTGEWFNVEEALQPEECLVFAGDPLVRATGRKNLASGSVCMERIGKAA